MRILVTGASEWIGSASVMELIAAGHHVLGLVRTDEAAAKAAKLGAEVVRGTLDDAAGLRVAAARAEGVAHLGYNHAAMAQIAREKGISAYIGSGLSCGPRKAAEPSEESTGAPFLRHWMIEHTGGFDPTPKTLRV